MLVVEIYLKYKLTCFPVVSFELPSVKLLALVTEGVTA
jgi:hypothetical protein